jgi:hypothetical protein
MDKKTQKERQLAFDSLPPAIQDCLSPEEIKLFLTADQWPEELFQKLDEFIVKE